MRRSGLLSLVVCGLLGGAGAARAQDVAAGGSPGPTAAPLPDPPPEGEGGSPPAALETVVRSRREPPESAARRDPSALTTVLPVSRFGVAARDIAEVLTRAPSVGVQDSGGWGQARSLVVRGAASNAVPVFLDGIPLAGAGGMVDLSRVPLALAERLEVVRGGAGTRYGGGGLGGAVNIVTRRPDAGSLLSGELALGPWNTQSGWAASSAPLGPRGGALLLLHAGRSEGDFDFDFDASPSTPDNPLEPRQRVNNDARAGGLLLRVAQRVGATDVDALAEGSGLERGLAGTDANPTQGRERDGRLALQLRARTGSLRTGELNARTFLRLQRSHISGITTRPSQVQRLAGGELEGRWRPGPAHLLSALVSASVDDVSGVDLCPEADGLPCWGRPRWGRFALMASDAVGLREGAFVLAPSVRLERAGPYTLLSPKLGLTAHLPARLVLRANAGQAHRAPSFTELYVTQGTLLPNADLRPERTLFADVGLTHLLPRGLGEVTAGAFASLSEDLITYELTAFGAKPFNVASARVAGLELEATLHPTPWLALAGSWALQDSRNVRDDPRYLGRALPFRPAHRGSARVVAGPQWLAARAELTAQSAQYAVRTEERAMPGRALLDVGLHSQLRPGARLPALSLALELRNATDVRTEDFDGYPLPSRGLFLTVGTSVSTARRPPPPDAPAPDERLDAP